jgi:exopolyphosphatase/pppGpp-phosphohydrolase
VAVIDVGSNSGRVMVYRQEAGGHLHVLTAMFRLSNATYKRG